MDPVLQSLIRYQEVSLELNRLRARLDQYPLQIEAVDRDLAAAEAAVKAAREAASDHQKERRKLEAEVQDLEVRLKKYNDQLMQVKTNDEYRAMQHEIAGVKGKISGVEDRILALMEEAETADRRIRDEERILEGRRKEGEASKAAVRQEQDGVQAEAARAAEQLEAARSTLGPDVLDLFDRIAQGRNGVAVARARDERCQECNVRIRPQNFQEIRRNDRIIQCDTCKRILYYIPDPPAGDATPADAPA